MSMGEHQDMEDLDERLTLVIDLDDYADEWAAQPNTWEGENE